MLGEARTLGVGNLVECDTNIAEIEAKAKEEGDAVQAQIKQLTDEHKVRLGRLECVHLALRWPATRMKHGCRSRLRAHCHQPDCVIDWLL